MLPLCIFWVAADASASDSLLGARWRSYALVQLGAEPLALPAPSAGSALRRAISADLERHGTLNGWSVSFAPPQGFRPLGEDQADFRSLTGAATGVSTAGFQAPLAVFYTDHTGIELQAVLAQQAYASNTLRYRAAPSVLPGREPWADLPSGKAVAVQVHSVLAPGWSVEAAAQSEVRMAPFQQVTGAYADPGQFDLPGRVQAEFNVAVAGQTSLRLGADHLFYSRIDPFLSRNLPAGVMALLGDAGSPRFEWRDLTVYSVAVDQSLTAARSVSLQMTTRQQPAPTSAALREALALSDGYNWSLQYRDRLGRGELSLSAAYAPDSYFLGPVLFRRDAVGGDQFEFEIGYRLSF